MRESANTLSLDNGEQGHPARVESTELLLWRSRGTEGFQRTKSPRVWLQILSAWATFLFKVHILPKHERSFPAPDLRRFEEERRGRKQLVTSPTSRSPCTRNSVTLTRKLHCRPIYLSICRPN